MPYFGAGDALGLHVTVPTFTNELSCSIRLWLDPAMLTQPLPAAELAYRRRALAAPS